MHVMWLIRRWQLFDYANPAAGQGGHYSKVRVGVFISFQAADGLMAANL